MCAMNDNGVDATDEMSEHHRRRSRPSETGTYWEWSILGAASTARRGV
jgi:hypothetical protein